MKKTENLCFKNKSEWHAWLSGNYSTKREVWLIYYKKHTGKPSISYDDSVEEASCFGWVDSIIRKIDDEKFARKFTPRTSNSMWSEANKKRVEKMIKEGRMTETGLTKIIEAKNRGKWFKTPVSVRYRKESVMPTDLRDALSVNKKALENFNKLGESYRRNFVGWVDSAKKEETRRKRIAEAVKLLERNEKLGLK